MFVKNNYLKRSLGKQDREPCCRPSSYCRPAPMPRKPRGREAELPGVVRASDLGFRVQGLGFRV